MKKMKIENFDDKGALEAPEGDLKFGSGPSKKHVVRRKSDLPQVIISVKLSCNQYKIFFRVWEQ